MCERTLAERKKLVNILSIVKNLITKPDTMQREAATWELGLASFADSHQYLPPSTEWAGGAVRIQVSAQRIYDGTAAEMEIIIAYAPYKDKEIAKVIIRSPGLVNNEAVLSDEDSIGYAQCILDFYANEELFSAPVFKVFHR